MILLNCFTEKRNDSEPHMRRPLLMNQRFSRRTKIKTQARVYYREVSGRELSPGILSCR